MITDKSQGSVAAHLRCDGLLSYHIIKYLLLSLVLVLKNKISEHWAKLQKEGSLSHAPTCLIMSCLGPVFHSKLISR